MIKLNYEILACKKCKGAGTVDNKVCPICLGFGYIVPGKINVEVNDVN
jgi:DnaJ-class molecular chaperone